MRRTVSTTVPSVFALPGRAPAAPTAGVPPASARGVSSERFVNPLCSAVSFRKPCVFTLRVGRGDGAACGDL
jgi:hypothetical protein